MRIVSNTEQRKRAAEKRRILEEKDRAAAKASIEKVMRESEKMRAEQERRSAEQVAKYRRHLGDSLEPKFLWFGRRDNGEKTATYLVTHWGYQHNDLSEKESKWRDNRMREFNTDYFEPVSPIFSHDADEAEAYREASNDGLIPVTYAIEKLPETSNLSGLIGWVLSGFRRKYSGPYRPPKH